MQLRIILLTLAAIPAAFLAWRDAAVEYWLYTEPDRAPALLRNAPRITLASSDVAVLSPGDKDKDFWLAVPAKAQTSLREAPLDAIAIRQMAFAAGSSDNASSVDMLSLAERVSRRDVPTQMALLRLAADAEDHGRTFLRLDRILTVAPAAGTRFFGPMAKLLADEPARRELMRYFGRRWFPAFALGAVRETEDPADLARLLIASGASSADAEPALLPALLERLALTGDYTTARELALRFGKAHPVALSSFALNKATTDARFAPLTWKLGQSEDVQTGLAPDKGVDVAIRPGQTVTIAERATKLTSGTYMIEQDVAPDDASTGLTLAWELRCGAGTTPSWRQAIVIGSAETYRERVDIPPGCAPQRWRLLGAADDAQSDAAFRLVSLQIARTP